MASIDRVESLAAAYKGQLYAEMPMGRYGSYVVFAE
jgi:hypothetical protein